MGRTKTINGAKISEWRLYRETQKLRDGSTKLRWAIRRWVVRDGKGRPERLPSAKYNPYDTEQNLSALVMELNAQAFKREIATEVVLDRNALLNPQLLDDYYTVLENEIPGERQRRAHFASLKRHVINVFVGKFGLTDPNDWYRFEERWIKYLRSDEAPPSAISKKYIVQILNRFMHWLHQKNRNRIALVQFSGINDAMLLDIERKRATQGLKKYRRPINPSDWERINTALRSERWVDIRYWILLCYHYGLRRAESLGLLFRGVKSVKRGYLLVERQLRSIDRWDRTQREFAPLKTQGRQGPRSRPVEWRKVPHWLDMQGKEELCADWIEAAEAHVMHPDTLTDRWEALMTELQLQYSIHELRYSWITRARAVHPSREVQLAAGHASIQTTERYSGDHRTQDDEDVRPSKAS